MTYETIEAPTFDLLPETVVLGAPPSRIVVTDYDLDGEVTLIGLRADKVHEVTSIAHDTTEETPRVGMRWRQDFIRRLARRAGDLIVIPDLDQIFAARGQSTATITPITSLQS